MHLSSILIIAAIVAVRVGWRLLRTRSATDGPAARS
jgi:hypothetical protein